MSEADMQPMMDEAAAEEQPMMMEEKVSSKKESVKESEEGNPYEETDMCCCCLCQCQEKEVKDLSCCGCFPIKCGVITIGALTLAITFLIAVETFYGLLNEYVEWWYIVICFVVLAPLFVAVGMFISFFSKDTEGTRTAVFAGCQLVVISVSLFCIWNTVYFLYFYKKDRVYFGNTETGYITLTKRQYFFWLFFFTAAVDAAYMYFICVTSAYSDRLKPKEVPPAMMEKMKEMMDEMMEEKMEEMMEEKMEEKMEEMAME